MNKKLSFPPLSSSLAGLPSWVQSTGYTILGFLAMFIASKISIPLWPVPLTLQGLAVLSIGIYLSPRQAAGAVGAFLLFGAFNLPVSAPQLSPLYGVTFLLSGPTGGYLVGFLVAAVMVAVMKTRIGAITPLKALMLCGAGGLVILGMGWAWLATLIGTMPALASGVVPFILGDSLKAAIAAALLVRHARG